VPYCKIEKGEGKKKGKGICFAVTPKRASGKKRMDQQERAQVRRRSETIGRDEHGLKRKEKNTGAGTFRGQAEGGGITPQYLTKGERDMVAKETVLSMGGKKSRKTVTVHV